MGVCEAEKWTDMTYQLMQFIQQRSNQQITFRQINQTFPYLKNVDESLVVEQQPEECPFKSPTPLRMTLSEIKARTPFEEEDSELI